MKNISIAMIACFLWGCELQGAPQSSLPPQPVKVTKLPSYPSLDRIEITTYPSGIPIPASRTNGGGIFNNPAMMQCMGMQILGGSALGSASTDCNVAVNNPSMYPAYQQQRLQTEQLKKMNSSLEMMRMEQWQARHY